MSRRFARSNISKFPAQRPLLVAYFIAFLSGDVAVAMENIAIAWHVFTLHHRVFDLGLVGLTLFAPAVAFVLVTGVYADRHDRRAIIFIATLVEVVAACALLALVVMHETHLWPFLAVLFAIGVARAFAAPAERGLLLAVVPHDRYLSVSATYSSIRALVSIGGPAAGGALVAIGTSVALGAAAIVLVISLAAIAAFRLPARIHTGPVPTMRDALGGLDFIRSRPIILGAISLDLFAVLFGGAVALLPAYADTILRVGPTGLGILRAAPAVGSFAAAAILARRPPTRRVGRTLLVAVATFGVATIAFGLSRNLAFSLIALAIVGGSDMISVVIRSGLVQLNTPDDVRGRVTAVENVFIGASNELGAFESGSLAALMGTVPSVVAGGLATLVVVALAGRVFPALRLADRMRGDER